MPLPTKTRPVGLSREARIIALIVAAGLLMEQFDSTVLGTALPSMARSFHTAPVNLSAAMTSYLLGLIVLIPASGRIADRFGSRTVFRSAIVLFTAGSILSAAAPSLPVLVAARLVQGSGGALMTPVGRLVLMRSVPKSQLISVMVWTLVPATIGPLLGPPVGGLLTTYLSWRWIFIVNVPIGLLGLVLAGRIPQMRNTGPVRFDLAGMALSGAALVCLVSGLELLSHGGHKLLLAAGLLTASFAAGALYLLHSSRVVSPILDLSLLRVATFRLSAVGGGASRILVGGTPFLVPSMLQLGFDLSAAQSGLITFTGTIGAFLMRLISQRVLRAVGYRTTMALNGASGCVLALCCAAFQPGWPFWLLSLILFLNGFSQALQFTALNTIAYADLSSEQMGGATGFYATLQQLALTLGICTAAGAVSASQALRHHPAVALADFSTGFVVIGLISLLAVPLCLRLPRDAGAEISGHRPAG